MLTLNKYFDHTILKANATEQEIKNLCQEAIENNFYSVCVNPSYVGMATRQLFGTNIKVAAVVGFPLGATTTTTKAFETEECIREGASEIDMVINIGKLKDRDFEYVKRDVMAVSDVAKKHKVVVKLILETCLLTEDEIVFGCNVAQACDVKFVKTSTGFSTGGATVEHVKLMKSNIDEDMEVKASGGIKTYEDAIKMIEAGATRIGSSASVEIMKNAK